MVSEPGWLDTGDFRRPQSQVKVPVHLLRRRHPFAVSISGQTLSRRSIEAAVHLLPPLASNRWLSLMDSCDSGSAVSKPEQRAPSPYDSQLSSWPPSSTSLNRNLTPSIPEQTSSSNQANSSSNQANSSSNRASTSFVNALGLGIAAQFAINGDLNQSSTPPRSSTVDSTGRPPPSERLIRPVISGITRTVTSFTVASPRLRAGGRTTTYFTVVGDREPVQKLLEHTRGANRRPPPPPLNCDGLVKARSICAILCVFVRFKLDGFIGFPWLAPMVLIPRADDLIQYSVAVSVILPEPPPSSETGISTSPSNSAYACWFSLEHLLNSLLLASINTPASCSLLYLGISVTFSSDDLPFVDSANQCDLKFLQFLVYEVACFDVFVSKLCAPLFTHCKIWAASELLDPALLFTLGNGEKFFVQSMRFSAKDEVIALRIVEMSTIEWLRNADKDYGNSSSNEDDDASQNSVLSVSIKMFGMVPFRLFNSLRRSTACVVWIDLQGSFSQENLPRICRRYFVAGMFQSCVSLDNFSQNLWFLISRVLDCKYSAVCFSPIVITVQPSILVFTFVFALVMGTTTMNLLRIEGLAKVGGTIFWVGVAILMAHELKAPRFSSICLDPSETSRDRRRLVEIKCLYDEANLEDNQYLAFLAKLEITVHVVFLWLMSIGTILCAEYDNLSKKGSGASSVVYISTMSAIVFIMVASCFLYMFFFKLVDMSGSVLGVSFLTYWVGLVQFHSHIVGSTQDAYGRVLNNSTACIAVVLSQVAQTLRASKVLLVAEMVSPYHFTSGSSFLHVALDFWVVKTVSGCILVGLSVKMLVIPWFGVMFRSNQLGVDAVMCLLGHCW